MTTNPIPTKFPGAVHVREVPQLYGLTLAENRPPVFVGTGEELALAMERAFSPGTLDDEDWGVDSQDFTEAMLDEDEAKEHLPVVGADAPLAVTVVDTTRGSEGATDAELFNARHIVTNTVQVPEHLQAAFAPRLKELSDSFRDFLVLEVATYEAALETATDDAGEIIRMITGTQQAEFSLGRASTLLKARIPELMALKWWIEKLELPDDIRQLLLDEYGYKAPPTTQRKQSLTRDDFEAILARAVARKERKQ